MFLENFVIKYEFNFLYAYDIGFVTKVFGYMYHKANCFEDHSPGDWKKN